MPNKSGNAYALTTLCPIRTAGEDNVSNVFYLRTILQNLPTGAPEDEKRMVSPMAAVPNTYLARFFILDDAIFQSFPYELDHLKSKYLVFTASFHGELEPYLRGMYRAAKNDVSRIWQYCIGFDVVKDEDSFVAYIKKCQVETTFFFNGSNDDPLDEQLKSLYLKQEFSKFVFEHQGASPTELLKNFKAFIEKSKPATLAFPTWKAGVSYLDEVVNDFEIVKQPV